MIDDFSTSVNSSTIDTSSKEENEEEEDMLEKAVEKDRKLDSGNPPIPSLILNSGKKDRDAT